MRMVVMVITVTHKVVVAPHHQLQKEHQVDSHKRNSFRPWIFGDNTNEALVSKGFVGWSEELVMSVAIMPIEMIQDPRG